MSTNHKHAYPLPRPGSRCHPFNMKKSAPPAPMMGVGLTPITTGLRAPFVGAAAPMPRAPPASAQLVCQGPNSWVLYVNEPVRVHLGLVLLWGSTSSSVAHLKAMVSNLLEPGTGFMKEYFLWMWSRGWFQDDSSTVYLLCTLFLLLLQQLHLRSSGIRYWKLTTWVLDTGSWGHVS